MNTKIDLPALLKWARGLNWDSQVIITDWIAMGVDQFLVQEARHRIAALIINGWDIPEFVRILAAGHDDKPETWAGLDHEVLVSIISEVENESHRD